MIIKVKDLVEALLQMPQEAELVTYHMGRYPSIASIDCRRLGRSDNYVELNLVFYEQ